MQMIRGGYGSGRPQGYPGQFAPIQGAVQVVRGGHGSGRPQGYPGQFSPVQQSGLSSALASTRSQVGGGTGFSAQAMHRPDPELYGTGLPEFRPGGSIDEDDPVLAPPSHAVATLADEGGQEQSVNLDGTPDSSILLSNLLAGGYSISSITQAPESRATAPISGQSSSYSLAAALGRNRRGGTEARTSARGIEGPTPHHLSSSGYGARGGSNSLVFGRRSGGTDDAGERLENMLSGFRRTPGANPNLPDAY